MDQISLKKLRELDPSLEKISDEDLEKVRQRFYNIAQFIYDERFGSKNPVRVLDPMDEGGTIKA